MKQKARAIQKYQFYTTGLCSYGDTGSLADLQEPASGRVIEPFRLNKVAPKWIDIIPKTLVSYSKKCGESEYGIRLKQISLSLYSE